MSKVEQRVILKDAILKARAVANGMCRDDLLRFTLKTMPTFTPADFHRKYYDLLDRFAKGDIKKLMVFMPPQHGKSEGSTRRLPAYLVGRDPNKRIAIISYSDTKARKFNREVQRIIDDPVYHDIFPDTILNMSIVSEERIKGYVRTSEEFEIVGHRGSVKAVGVGGPLTGDPVDILIMDDLYKNAKDAWSPTIRETVNDWYDTVAETRLHNDSQQLMVFTRWHVDDLAGRMIKMDGLFDPETNPDGWVVVIFPAIKIGGPTDLDPRQEGEALWPQRHSLRSLQAIQKKNPIVFGSLYQQDPRPAEGMLYERGFRTYSVIPYDAVMKRKNYTDTADDGSDYLCSIDYVETTTNMYVLDVLYTQKPMEVTETRTAEMLCKDNIDTAIIESNNGGKGFARAVERIVRLMGNKTTAIEWIPQTDNKLTRIFTQSAAVQNLIVFPEGWDKLWPVFYNAVTGFLRVGKNEHDDAPDVLTAMTEHFGDDEEGQDLTGLF